MLRRIDKKNWSGGSSMIRLDSVKYELAEKQQAIARAVQKCRHTETA